MTDTLASQVAAGEVVERPESVVRELLDNAIDAGARRIEVRVEKGGSSLIALTDDGQGMGRDDAVLALERHATSKLQRIEDLQSLRTMGFRGEALPSIASVSRFTMRTREHGSVSGTRVEVEGGVVRMVREDGCAPGTSVEVRSLFFNVPARRKFLRGIATEFGHVEHRVRLMAAAHPSVGFTLFHDGREVLRVAPGQDLRGRSRELLGSELGRKLLDVEMETSRGRVEGMCSPPGLARPTRRMIHFFVNRRPVESAILRSAVADAYAGLIERGTHPACVLFLDLDPGDCDINVHPAKREIRFRDPGFVQDLLREALESAVRRPAPNNSAPRERAVLPPEASDESEDKLVLPQAVESRGTESSVEIPRDAPKGIAPKETKADMLPGQATWEAPVTPSLPEPQEIAGLFPESVDARGPVGLASAVHLGAVLGSYEIFALDDGLLLMERRAAVERILFEWLTAHRGEADASQGLLIPIPLSLAPQEMEEIEPHLPALRDLGIGVEPFGPRTLLLTSLPTLVQSEDPGALARLVLGGVRAAAQGKRGPLERRALLAVVSRELAGGGRALPEFGSGPELLRRLLACEMPYCCPRGRATLSQLSRGDLARRFGLA
ncbi:MAG: DNA mismatch repair endonuclease MutL [Verrucomicrobiales bacterium]